MISNLYPFRQTVAAGATQAEAIEQIDIGGPSMVRASAKNHGSVAIVVEPGSYAAVLAAVRSGGFDLAERQALAARAFRHTASYDIAVAGWLGSAVTPDDEGSGFPGWLGRDWERAAILRYGENPHQRAALYVDPEGRGLAQAEQLSGKDMSFNNYVDADAAYRAAYDFGDRTPRASRSSSTPTPAASRWAPTWPTPTPRPTPATRSARSAASSPPTPR